MPNKRERNVTPSDLSAQSLPSSSAGNEKSGEFDYDAKQTPFDRHNRYSFAPRFFRYVSRAGVRIGVACSVIPNKRSQCGDRLPQLPMVGFGNLNDASSVFGVRPRVTS